MFAGVSFALAPSEALLVRGPNGAGKSSLLRLLAGLLEPATGALSWYGTPVRDDPAAHRGRLHLIGHRNAIKSALTARENLGFATAVFAVSAGGIDQALERFDLAALAEVPARYLSAGQRRRLALARLVVAAARPLWLLDEPDAGLDAANREHLAGAIARHRAEGGIAVIATHGDIGVRAPHVLELAA